MTCARPVLVYPLFSENVSGSVVETFGDIWHLQVRPFCVERSRVERFWECIVWSIVPSGYPLRRRTLSNMF